MILGNDVEDWNISTQNGSINITTGISATIRKYHVQCLFGSGYCVGLFLLNIQFLTGYYSFRTKRDTSSFFPFALSFFLNLTTL